MLQSLIKSHGHLLSYTLCSNVTCTSSTCTLRDLSDATPKAVEVTDSWSKLILPNDEGNYRHDEEEEEVRCSQRYVKPRGKYVVSSWLMYDDESFQPIHHVKINSTAHHKKMSANSVSMIYSMSCSRPTSQVGHIHTLF